jgi:hypothetical protein
MDWPSHPLRVPVRKAADPNIRRFIQIWGERGVWYHLAERKAIAKTKKRNTIICGASNSVKIQREITCRESARHKQCCKLHSNKSSKSKTKRVSLLLCNIILHFFYKPQEEPYSTIKNLVIGICLNRVNSPKSRFSSLTGRCVRPGGLSST